MAVLYHTRVLLDLDGWTLMAGPYHTRVLLALMAVLYHTRVLLDFDGWSISYLCPLGP